jgi:hypothetical protein
MFIIHTPVVCLIGNSLHLLNVHLKSVIEISSQEKVLHNVMPIFTFMGVSVLRQDDTYSFQVIKKTVEAVIPALIQVWNL